MCEAPAEGSVLRPPRKHPQRYQVAAERPLRVEACGQRLGRRRIHREQPSFLEEKRMPKPETIKRARKDAREGKSPTTQAGEFVRDQIRDIRRGEHGARSTKQAIAIGLSEARRAGVPLPPPKAGKTSMATRRKAMRDSARGRANPNKPPSPKRSRATLKALKREGRSAASRKALSQHARTVARRKTAAERSAAGKKAAKTRKAHRRPTR
jgi:hypothetical protein